MVRHHASRNRRRATAFAVVAAVAALAVTRARALDGGAAQHQTNGVHEAFASSSPSSALTTSSSRAGGLGDDPLETRAAVTDWDSAARSMDEGEGEEVGEGPDAARAKPTVDDVKLHQATPSDSAVTSAKSAVEDMMRVLEAAVKATEAEAGKAEAARAEAEAALKDKEEAVNQARTEADTAKAAAAQEETQAADKARADQVAMDAKVAEAQRALDVARAEAAQSGSSKETQSADLVNARDAIEVWTLKLKQAQDEVEIATKAATHALETKELAKSDEAIAAATELVAAKDAAKQAAIDAMNTATNELQNAKRKLSELSRAVIQVSADSSGDSNNAYLAEVELNVKRAAREQLSFNEDARRQNSLAREAVRDENARAVVAAKEKMLQCAREQLDKVAEGAAQAKAKHDAAVQAKEQAARLIDAIKNAESALGYDADHTNSTNDACPAVVAEKKPFPEEIEPKVAEVVKVQREEKHEHEEEPSEQSSPSAYPSSERSEQSSPSAYPSSERSEQSSPRAYPSSERSVSSSKPTPTYASTSPTQEESTEQRTRAPLPTPERVPEEDAAEEEVSEETKTDEMLLEKCSDCATVSSDIALSGYSTETFDGSARDAFVNGMAQTLGVADDEVVITSVTATSTAKTLTGRALLAEGGVLVKFTVLVEDDTTASQVEDNLLAAKTDPAVAETVKANMIDAGLQDVKTIDIPATPTRVTKAAYAAKVVAVKANMERRESAAKKQVASRSEAVKALMDEYKAKISAFVDDAKVKITAAWDNANDVERVLTVLVLVLALYLLYRILAFACCCCCRRRRDTQDAGSSSSLRRDAAKSSAYGAV